MYKITIEKIGEYEIYCLENADSSSFVKIAPDKGATISDLKLANQSIYDGYSNLEDLETLAWGRGILLGPFPNRLKDGKYSFEGKNYQFPINDTATGTALHGFVNQLKFTLGDVKLNEEKASISCHTYYDGNFEYYPFPFLAEIQYSLSKKEGLSLCFSITNRGKSNMPVGLGWHPYFTLSEKVNNSTLQLPKLEMIEIDGSMIPTGKLTPFNIFEKLAKIDDFVLDNCFKLEQSNEFARVIIEGEKGRLIYTQSTDIPYLQVFTPPHRNSIALEPMTCNVDAFNNEDGLKILAPNETIELKCQVNLESHSPTYRNI